jgi:hypothetical protein
MDKVMARIVGLMLMVLIGAGLISPGAAGEEEDELDVGKPKIEMAPFNFSLIRQGRVEGKVTLHLTLVIEEEGAHEKVRLRVPQLRSDFNSALSVLARQRFTVSRPINPDVVRSYLTPYAVHRLGAGVVSIYVQQALIEPA